MSEFETTMLYLGTFFIGAIISGLGVYAWASGNATLNEVFFQTLFYGMLFALFRLSLVQPVILDVEKEGV